MEPDPALINSILEIESLRIIGKPEGTRGSRWVRLVEDAEGRRHYLKITTVYAMHHNEAIALAEWAEHGLAPEHRVLNHDPPVLLISDLGGRHLRLADQIAPSERRMADIAALARALHEVPPPEGLMTTGDLVRHRSARKCSDAVMREVFGRELTGLFRRTEAELITAEHEGYFIHGDFRHHNIIATDEGLKAIDPHGLIGDRACDLAFIAARRSDPESAFEGLLSHYGERPPRAGEWFRWALVMAHLSLREREGYGGEALAALEQLL